MSRLYDRILAEGCSPITLDDMLGQGQARFTSEWLEWTQTTFGLVPLDEIPSERRRIGRQLTARLRSTDVLKPDEVENAVVISAEEVAEYWNTLPGSVVVRDLLDVLAAPFDRLFVEFQRPSRCFGFESWGVLFTSEQWEDERVLDAPHGRKVSIGGWVLQAALVGEWRKGHPVGPVGRTFILLDEHGRFRAHEDDTADMFQAAIEIPGVPEEHLQPFAEKTHLFGRCLAPALFAISLMHCKNVNIRPVDPPERLSRKQERKHGRPLTRYHVLEIEPMRRVLDTEGEAQTKGLRHALHICRGHFKTFTEEAPLFGRLVGTYWWPAHARGSGDEGTVEKDYRIRLEGEGVGRSYRRADEEVIVAPAEVRADDPDTSQRGLRAHNRTQNLLAQAIEEAGFTPRSPKAEEPDFDLAWEDGETVWVAEVKSTTERSEEHQMRLAIGQVIRYRQQLAEVGRDVRAMIAVENAPFDESFIALCGTEGIALVWPEVMAQALGARADGGV